MATSQIEVKNQSGQLQAILTPEDGVTDASISRRLNGDCELEFNLPATSDKLQYLIMSNLLYCDNRVFVLADPDSVSHIRRDGELWANIRARERWVLLDRSYKTLCNDDAAKPINDLDVVITKTGAASGSYATGSAGSALSHLLAGTSWGTMFPPASFSRNSIAYKQDGTQVAADIPRYEAGKYGQAVVAEEGTVPLLTQNQASVETDTTGFVANSATITRVTTEKYHGSASLQVVTNNLGAWEGFFITKFSASADTAYSAQARVKGISGTVRFYLRAYDASGTWLGEISAPITLNGTWQQVKVENYVTPTGTTQLDIAILTPTQQGITFYYDCGQVEQKAFCTSWTDVIRVAEVLSVPTAGIFTKGNWTIEGVYIPKIPTNVGITAKMLFDCYINGDNFYLFRVNWDGKWYLEVRSDGDFYTITGGSTTQDTIYFWSISGNGSVLRLCVNGVQIGSDLAYTEPVGTLPANIYIGCNSNGSQQANGLIDDFRVSNRARTLAEHQSSYNSGLPLPIDANTTAKYSFDNTLESDGDYYWPTGQHEIRTAQESILANIKQVKELWGGYLVWNSAAKSVVLQSESWLPYTGYAIHLGKNLKGITRSYDFDVITKLWVFGQNDVDIFDVNTVHSGTAQAGGASTITLATAAVGVYGAYIDGVIYITGGTGSGQSKRIIDYNGDTKIATVESNWTTVPNSTSTYEIKARFLLNFGYTSELRSHVWRNQDIVDPSELKSKGQEIHAKLAYPRVHYKVEHVDLRTLTSHAHETFTVGDMVDIIDAEMGIAIQTRVIYHKYNVFQPWLCDIELGDESYELKQILGELKKQSRVNYRLGRSPSSLIIASAGTTKNTRRADIIVPEGSTSAQKIINHTIGMFHDRGGKVTLLDGEYIVDGSIILPSNVTLEISTGATVKLKNNCYADVSMITNSDHTNGNTNIKVVGEGVIDGNKAQQYDYMQHGVYFGRVSNSTVKGLTVINAYVRGIQLAYSSKNNIIMGNTCQGNGHNGIHLGYLSNDNTVTGNTCQGNGNVGIYLVSSNNTVTGNTCNGNSYYGVHLNSASNNSVTGNTCQGNGYVGIYIHSSLNNTVAGNTCLENGGKGIELLARSEGNTVTGNTCQGNGQEGIMLYYSANNAIVGNACIENSRTADNYFDNIYLYSDCDYNNIQNNICRVGSAANKPRYGINIASSDCDGNLVTNNDLITSGVSGSFNNAGTNTQVNAGNRL